MFFIILIILAGIGMYFLTSLSGMFLFWGIMDALLFFNVTLSTMTNALRGLSVDVNDTFSRIVLIFLASVFLTFGICF